MGKLPPELSSYKWDMKPDRIYADLHNLWDTVYSMPHPKCVCMHPATIQKLNIGSEFMGLPVRAIEQMAPFTVMVSTVDPEDGPLTFFRSLEEEDGDQDD